MSLPALTPPNEKNFELTYHLSLCEAVCLLALGTANYSAVEEKWWNPSELEAQRLRNVTTELLVRLRSGHIHAEGKWGNVPVTIPSGSDATSKQEWGGHAIEWRLIPAGAWEFLCADWTLSKLKTRHGEYMDVRFTESDIQKAANTPKHDFTLKLEPEPETTAPLLLITQANAPFLTEVTSQALTAPIPTYTTKLLSIVDTIRQEIATDTDRENRHWTRGSIATRAVALGAAPGVGDRASREAQAIATVLLPDEVRGKK